VVIVVKVQITVVTVTANTSNCEYCDDNRNENPRVTVVFVLCHVACKKKRTAQICA
jgi:hypothetical protein